ncbi:MAG: Amino acid transporter fused to UspA-like domain [Candidatus Methanohalarchaeum thermophilum]|uniref:Amino acid transporter fused to UspA-like domain n=1 Tax=Methanohalarchaeum thermophilum TaxID=1903181 RepID=A0A1Q6DWN1_METT1|nr:MAG: Amino acid transporter fused to UspA-like domain [Candidatus Methanohalarchaeum thermophilum]
MAELKKELDFFDVCFYGIGLILGAGIYVILGEAAGLTGPSLVFAFIFAALLAALTGLSYAELSSIYPRGEAEYIYVRRAFESKKLAEITALFRILVGVISSAAVALSFPGYLSTFIEVPEIPVAIGVVLVFSIVNYFGINLSSKINIGFTLIELAGLVIVISVGVGYWGSVDITETPFGSLGLVKSLFLIFFSYIGFESIVNVSEETKEANKNIPKAIVVSLLITTFFYILVAFSSVSIVDWQVLGKSTSPLSLVVGRVLGETGTFAISLIALFAITNTVLIILISTSRLLYGVSKKEYKSFPSFFSKIHSNRKTPYRAVAGTCALTIFFVLLGDIGLVAGLANFFLLIVFAIINLSLLKLRFKKIDREKTFKAPLNIGNISITATSGFISSLVLIIFYLNQLI